MTAEELKKMQEQIHEKIDKLAEKKGLKTDEVWPIPDGVYDEELYLAATPRIMWVLKESPDEESDGKVYGGGWKLYTAYDNPDAWKNKTLQPIIYTSYGILNHKKWDDMPWIREDNEMVDILKKIAYVNISKMPAKRVSNDRELYDNYDIWKGVLLEQIKVYNPEIIVFGNTFKYFKNDLVGEDAKPTKSIGFEGKSGEVKLYEHNGVKMIAAYHPVQRRIKRGEYVNSIIELCI